MSAKPMTDDPRGSIARSSVPAWAPGLPEPAAVCPEPLGPPAALRLPDNLPNNLP